MLVDPPNSLSEWPKDGQGSGRRRVSSRHSPRRRGALPKMLVGVRQVFEQLPGWWLATLLVIAPWAYGATFPETKDLLAMALCGLSLPFAISLILERRWPRVNWVSVLLALIILAQGWLMTWNAKLIYDPRVLFFHRIPQPVGWLPGTVDQATSWHQMLLITGLFFAFCVASDLAARERWRRRLWLMICLTGVSLMILGLVQRATAAPGIFWRIDLDCGLSFFATYRYHGNAGAFINIILPLVAAQSICAFQKSDSHLAKAFWLLATMCVLASAFVNVSRAATVITVCLVVLFAARQLHELLGTNRHFTKRQAGVVAAIVVIGVGALVWAIGFTDAYKHWSEPRYNMVVDGRLADGRFIVYDRIGHHVLPKAGWWGFGPATFALVFPFFTNDLGAAIKGYWAQAHDDYLQSLVEWGFVGATLWFLFFGNTIVRAVLTFWRRKRAWDSRMRTFGIACFLALGAVLIHSTVDFPLQIASLQLYTSVVLGFLASLEYSTVHRSRRFRLIAVDEEADGEERPGGVVSGERQNGARGAQLLKNNGEGK
jgi:O-Antigen ligase